MDIKEFQKLKQKSEELQRKSDKASGQLDQLKSQLSKEFNCSNLNEAEELIKKLDGNHHDLKEQYDIALDKFKKKWGKLLGDL